MSKDQYFVTTEMPGITPDRIFGSTPRPPHVISFDIGGTNTRLLNRDLGQVEQWPTPEDYDQSLDQLYQAVQKLGVVDAAGVAVAGVVEDGFLVMAGELEAHGWVGNDIQGDVADCVGTERRNVTVLNDCVAAGVAQQTHNASRSVFANANNGLVLTYSTGHGGTYFANEADGSTTLVALEPGHEPLWGEAKCGCGSAGHVESYIGGAGIARRFGKDPTDLEDWEWQSRVVPYMAAALAQLIGNLEKNPETRAPEVIYYFGSIAVKQPVVIPTLERLLGDYAQPPGRLFSSPAPKFEPAHYGEDGGLVGARFAAEQNLQSLRSDQNAATEDQILIINNG